MKKTKYIMSGGLAFAEEKDMEKLRQYSLKGWHVSDHAFMGYTLEKGEPKEYIYSIDYRPLEADEEEEYFAFFSGSGWSPVASEAGIHLFQAAPGTKPIYSDRDTSVEKYSNLSKSTKNITIPLFLVTVLVWAGAFLASGILNSILLTVGAILSVFALPVAWTEVATYSNKWRAKGKTGIANLLKFAPVSLFLIAVIILLLVYVPDHAIRILTSAVIGGVAVPSLIWIILSLYHKIKKNKA